jgi:glyoxylase-like metal-dependent hydrolase (beta-lactamase superfamily II)
MSTTICPLYLGTFSVGLDKKFNRINQNEDAEKGALKISLNPFLIKHENQLIMVDCGLGEFGEESHIPFLISRLAEYDVKAEDITDIFLSHLHFDHIGGLAFRESGFWELTFPNAKVWLSGEEWHKLLSLDQSDPLKEQYLHYIETHVNLNYVNDGDKPMNGVEIRVVGGHTEFSLAILFNLDGIRILNAGDVIGTKGHITKKFAAKYDFDGKKSQRVRDELIAMANDENYIILAYHDNEIPVFRVNQHSDKTYVIEKVNLDSTK